MARKKVTLAYIESDAQRKASFKKRRKGLVKKVSEIKTLCGVEACAVIYSPFEAAPVVWPSHEVAETVMQRFQQLPTVEKAKKMVNQESFAQHQVKRAEERLRRAKKDIKRKELENFMYKAVEGRAAIDDLDPSDGRELSYLIHETLEGVTSRIKALEEGCADGGLSSCGGSSDGGGSGDGGGPPSPDRSRIQRSLMIK